MDEILCISREAFLKRFAEECGNLPYNSKKEIVMGENVVTVYKDGEYSELFDVHYIQNEDNSTIQDYCGIHLHELEDLAGQLLIQGYQAKEKRIEINTGFGQLSARIAEDPHYPGIVVCIERSDGNEKYDYQLARAEYTPDMPEKGQNSLRLLVWSSGENEDYTNAFTFFTETPEKESKETIWEKYTLYLRDWSASHKGAEFYGMTPSGFNEWLDNEYAEESQNNIN